eukprot:TRINITY_DN3434_c0_g1_i3.p1 TRINITY_DN3434_c0_g1~~TRINITY_DN3434_c0_g1_i3.p1  ORF type:complete len:384 (+),score=48.18 TRINITY_DN3434_c0_g1_i3:55-1206(+)
MSTIVRLVRRQVSNDKRRYTKDGYDLDLSYITDRIIAMSFPAEGVEKMYRNDIDDVSTFLHKIHGKNFMVFNLSERKYDYSKFSNLVTDCGFPDHHSPPLDLLFKICKAIDAHLLCSEQNVAVIHCKAGKGRTGTTIAAYMLYCGLFNTVEKALKHFGDRRSNRSIGVTWPSQIRYVHYFYRVCYESYYPHPLPLRLKTLTLSGHPIHRTDDTYRTFVEVFCAGTLIYSSADTEEKRANLPLINRQDPFPVFDIDVAVRGDIYVRCYQYSKGRASLFFRVQFHTGFVSRESPTFVLSKYELDEACKDPSIDDEFAMVVDFRELTAAESPPELIDNFNWNIHVDDRRIGLICYFPGPLSAADFEPDSLADSVKSEILARPVMVI